MKFSGYFEKAPFLAQFFLVLGLLFSGMFIGNLVFSLLAVAVGIPLEESLITPYHLRNLQFWTSLFTFLIPALFLAYVFSQQPSRYLQTKAPQISSLVITIFCLIAAMPFLNWVIYLNNQIVFPEALSEVEASLRAMEDRMAELTKLLLTTQSNTDFIFNIIVFAVVAALGEELFFRGVLQRVFAKLSKNPHLVIWVVAILFSALHFQFYGFFPRMLLGALMGYLLLWTGSIWVPITAHFINNLVGVVAYRYLANTEQMEQFENIGVGDSWWVAVVSLLASIALLYVLKKKARETATVEEQIKTKTNLE